MASTVNGVSPALTNHHMRVRPADKAAARAHMKEELERDQVNLFSALALIPLRSLDLSGQCLVLAGCQWKTHMAFVPRRTEIAVRSMAPENSAITIFPNAPLSRSWDPGFFFFFRTSGFLGAIIRFVVYSTPVKFPLRTVPLCTAPLRPISKGMDCTQCDCPSPLLS